jgi:hypothetical protein
MFTKRISYITYDEPITKVKPVIKEQPSETNDK